MADVQIPREVVEAGARALNTFDSDGLDQWDQLLSSEKAEFFGRALLVLNAAAPHIVAAELDRMVTRMPSRQERSGFAAFVGLDERAISTLNVAMDEIQAVLRDRAKYLRGES